jgi:hypothetical protein
LVFKPLVLVHADDCVDDSSHAGELRTHDAA